MDGILIINKEQGFTSHDVVAKLRGILHQKKIGHTGTLDPDATGVLPVCLGRATKVCELLTDTDKTYEAVLRLGVTTDTQDMSGQILSVSDLIPEEARVTEVVKSFIGEGEQIPPMYSALKVNGKKLVDLAREGKTVERKPRPVHIYDIQILSCELPRVKMRVDCSKGTYIRTLCHDIGEVLGCGGAMESLVRTRAAGFTREEALTLSEVEKFRDEGTLEERILPLEKVFFGLPRFVVNEEGARYLKNGNPLRRSQGSLSEEFPEQPREEGENPSLQAAVYFPEGTFAAVYEWDFRRRIFMPVKMFL